MARVKVRDEIGRSDVELDIDDHITAREAVDELLSHLGLPRYATTGAPLPYSLAVDGRVLPDPNLSLAEAGMADGTTLTLLSPEARETWSRIQSLIAGLRGEVAAGVRTEVRTAGDRIRTTAVEEARGFVRSITGEIEAEVVRRVRGAGKQISLWTRHRIRRVAKQLARTGAMPDEFTALSFATGQLSRVAQAAMVAPVAAVALAATAMATVAAAEAREARGIAERAVMDASVAGELAGAAREAARAADARAEAASASAATAQATAEIHRDDRTDPHEVQVLETVGNHVEDGLSEGDAAGWVGSLLDAAEQRIDSHLSTDYESSGVEIELRGGESLWNIAETALHGAVNGAILDCERLPAQQISARDIASYVADLWVANAGIVGSDAGALETGTTLQMVCPRNP